MWKWLCIATAAISLGIADSAEAQAASEQSTLMRECGRLLRPKLENIQSNRIAYLAQLKTSEYSDNNSRSNNVSVSAPGYGSGSFGSKDSSNKHSSEYNKINWSTEDYLGYVASYVPKDAYPAYNACVGNVLRSEGVHLRVLDADAHDIVFQVNFVGAQGSTLPYTLTFSPIGAVEQPFTIRNVAASGFTRIVNLHRKDVRRSLKLIVNVSGGPTNPSGDFVSVPPEIKMVPVITLRNFETASPSDLHCSGNNNANPREGPDYGPPPLGAGEEFVPAATRVEVTSRGSWDDNRFLSNPPFFSIVTNTPVSIRAHTICMPNNPDSETWLSTKIVYQVRSVGYKIVWPT